MRMADNIKKKKEIVYMVSVIVDGRNVVGYKLLNLGLAQCVNISCSRLEHLMKNGYTVCNLRLNSHDKIESVPKGNILRRYTCIDSQNRIVAYNIPNVLLSKFRGPDNERCMIYNNVTERLEFYEYNSVEDSYFDYVSNAIDMREELVTSLYDRLAKEWELVSEDYKKIKVHVDNNLNLEELAVYEEGAKLEVDNCIWVQNLHHTCCKELVIHGMTYGIAKNGIRNVRVKKLDVDVQIMEKESIIDSEIDELNLIGNTWYTGVDLIKGCKIHKLVVGDQINITNNLVVDCDINEIEFKGNPLIKDTCRSLIENCRNLRYITLSKDISDDSYEKISRLVGTKVKILT